MTSGPPRSSKDWISENPSSAAPQTTDTLDAPVSPGKKHKMQKQQPQWLPLFLHFICCLFFGAKHQIHGLSCLSLQEFHALLRLLIGSTSEGDIVVDDISSLNMYLTDSSTYNGAINKENEDGEIYVEIEEGSKWVLTGDSYVTSLTCQSGSIDTNGYKLYINGEEYVEGNTYNGEAVVVATTNSNSQSHNNSMPQGTPPEKPNSSNNKEKKR